MECLRLLSEDAPGFVPRPAARPAQAPLNISQENLYRIAEHLYPLFGSMFTPEGFLLALPEGLDYGCVASAYQALFSRHRALGIGFAPGGDRIPYQAVNDRAPTLRQMALGEDAELPSLADALALLSGFDDLNTIGSSRAPRLEDAGFPLFRSAFLHGAGGRRWFAMYLDQMICDGTSLSLVYRDMVELLVAEREGRPAKLAPTGADFAAYCAWEHRFFRRSDRYRRNLEFWRRYRDRNIPLYLLPPDSEVTLERLGRGDALPGETVIAELQGELVEQIYRCSAASKVTVFGVLLSAMLVHLAERQGENAVAISSLFANRPPGCKDVVGSFSQVAQVGMAFPRRMAFHDVLGEVQRHLLQVQQHVNLADVELLSPEQLYTNQDSLNKGMPVTLSMESYLGRGDPRTDIADELIGAVTGEDTPAGRRYLTAPLDNFTVYLRFVPNFTERRLRCVLQYCTVAYSRSTVENLMDEYLSRLRSLTAEPGQLVPA